ncbi:unnamed protein product, partial [Brassica rapa subsp. trilocularis]
CFPLDANSYKKKNKRRPHKRGIEDGFHHQNNQHRQFEMAVEEEKCGGNQYRQLEAGDICSGLCQGERTYYVMDLMMLCV